MWKHYKSISLGLVALASFASAQGGFPTKHRNFYAAGRPSQRFCPRWRHVRE
jgi:hypothetical protein